MTQPRFILALISFTLFACPASAGDCLRLCDYSFMQTATAQDINTEIDKGADLHARTTDSLSPLHFAALSGNTEAVSALLAAGADVEVRTKNNSTPLHLAAIRGNAPTINTLLKAGANREARNRLAGTPLHYAAGNGNAETITALLNAGANARARGLDGEIPYDLARLSGKLTGTKVLQRLKDAAQ